MVSKSDDLYKVQMYFRESLLKNGWEEMYMEGSFSFMLNSYVINIASQCGELAWTGYEYDESLDKPHHHDLLCGYHDHSPDPIAVFRISGTPDTCKVLARSASVGEGLFYSGKMEGAFDKLLSVTCYEIKRYSSLSGPQA